MFKLCSLPILSIFLFCAPEVDAANTRIDITGTVKVIDGDTLDVAGTRVRLHGIDAPEKAQTCTRNRRNWDCGAEITHLMRERYDGRSARCATQDIDHYGRHVARCAIGGEDVGSYLVGQGYAFAYTEYSTDYVALEAEASAAGRGLWGANVQRPSEFRAAQRQVRDAKTAAQKGPEGCEIKGNISNSGQIYHQPGQRDYDRVSIDESSGERWFCSAREAEAAGWRAARR